MNWFWVDVYCFGIICVEFLFLKRFFEDVFGSELYEELFWGVRFEFFGECLEDLVVFLKDCWVIDF